MIGNVYEFLDEVEKKKRKISGFLDHLLKTDKVKSAETYYYQLKILASYLDMELEELDYNSITPVSLSECMAGMNPNSANTLLAAVRSYARYLKKTATNRREYNDFSWFYDSISEIEYRTIPKIALRKGIKLEKLAELLEILRDEHLLSATVVHFYLGARPVELAQEFVEGEITLEEVDAKRKIDFKNRLISIVTAKTHGSMRIAPIDERVLPFFRIWYEELDKVLELGRPREWFTSSLRKFRRIGFRITAKTARQTFETEMRGRMDQWKVNYILGHATTTPDIYTGWEKIIKDLGKELSEKHYLFDGVFEKFWQRSI